MLYPRHPARMYWGTLWLVDIAKKFVRAGRMSKIRFVGRLIHVWYGMMRMNLPRVLEEKRLFLGMKRQWMC